MLEIFARLWSSQVKYRKRVQCNMYVKIAAGLHDREATTFSKLLVPYDS